MTLFANIINTLTYSCRPLIKVLVVDKEEIKPADAKLDKGKKPNQTKTSNMALLYTSGFATPIILFPKMSVFIVFFK